MLKKLVCLGVVIVMLFSLAGCNNYKYNESDFNLVVTVDKTEAQVGDIIIVTATLTNLSGKDIPIRYFGSMSNVGVFYEMFSTLN